MSKVSEHVDGMTERLENVVTVVVADEANKAEVLVSPTCIHETKLNAEIAVDRDSSRAHVE